MWVLGPGERHVCLAPVGVYEDRGMCWPGFCGGFCG